MLPAVVFLAMLALYLVYEHLKFKLGKETWPVLCCKGGCTLCAALFSLYSYTGTQSNASLFIVMAVFIFAAADVMLCRIFFVGLALFGLGHIMLLTAFVIAAPIEAGSVWVFSALFILTAGVVLYVYIKEKTLYETVKKMIAPFVLYAVVLSAVFALSLYQKPLLFFGALLFLLSDLLLAWNMTGHRTKKSDYLSLGMYFLSQYLLALSVAI